MSPWKCLPHRRLRRHGVIDIEALVTLSEAIAAVGLIRRQVCILIGPAQAQRPSLCFLLLHLHLLQTSNYVSRNETLKIHTFTTANMLFCISILMASVATINADQVLPSSVLPLEDNPDTVQVIPDPVTSVDAEPTEIRYDCRGSTMCPTIHVKACDEAVNSKLIRDDNVNYGAIRYVNLPVMFMPISLFNLTNARIQERHASRRRMLRNCFGLRLRGLDSRPEKLYENRQRYVVGLPGDSVEWLPPLRTQVLERLGMQNDH